MSKTQANTLSATTIKKTRAAKPAKSAVAAPPTKIAKITALLRRPEGAGIVELMTATGWQAHSVRGALSGTLKKQLKLNVTSEKTEAGRVYRIVEEAAA